MKLQILFFCLIGVLLGSTSFKPNTDPDVYVAGRYGGEAVYWKNGVMHPLHSRRSSSIASAIFVDNQDVYVAGMEFKYFEENDSTVIIGKYWKNGREHILSTQAEGFKQVNEVFYSLKSICVNKQDVYVGAGNFEINHSPEKRMLPCYWKNGQIILPSSDPAIDGCAQSMFVSNDTVYVAGWKSHYSPAGNTVVYWKNGKQVSLTNGENYAYATAMYVSGEDVYVIGEETIMDDKANQYIIAKYWKNGKQTQLSPDNRVVHPSSIFVSGQDVYVAGMEQKSNTQVGIYWKNGKEVKLIDRISRASLESVYVLGTDVYIAGWDRKGKNSLVAKYWKNDREIKLSDGKVDAIATSIFVTR